MVRTQILRYGVLSAAALMFLMVAVPADAQTLDSSTLQGFLPSPAGWTMQAPQTLDQAVAGTSVSQAVAEYSDGDGTRVRVSLIVSSSMAAASRSMGMAFRNGQMIGMMNDNAAAKGRQVIYGMLDREGWEGWTVVNGDEGTSEATGMLEETVVKVEAEIGDAAVLDAFLDAIDWEGLLAAQ